MIITTPSSLSRFIDYLLPLTTIITTTTTTTCIPWGSLQILCNTVQDVLRGRTGELPALKKRIVEIAFKNIYNVLIMFCIWGLILHQGLKHGEVKQGMDDGRKGHVD